ncbi:fatty acid CoA ligase family protein [Anatilimnocola floriformis]|uniref:fatty acid CoA ligase family protein n=1 Tax=Anatilimnocola floriformis TaxID=2948575 RepID=UPI0020C38348|nr:fatty acid CoA ligase family protein [Anatilimnocola floriformis]
MNSESLPAALNNVGFRLSETARHNPNGMAIAMPRGRDAAGKRKYESLTFRELDDDTNRIAAGLHAMGVQPGMKLVLMVPPSIDFIALVFALFKSGVVQVLIDPGMGRGNLIRCLSDSQPDGFIGIPLAQAVRVFLRGRFPKAKFNVTVGRRWFWGGKTLQQLREMNAPLTPPITKPADPAAIIFTTGSTGPPKGVLYRHGNFNRQADEIRDFYHIQPGEIDLPGFPLFALFNCAMGVSTVIPDMDPTRPAKVNPQNIIEAVNDWQVTQAFGSPALWNVVGQHCEKNNITLPSLKRIMSAGAPVPPHVLKRMKHAIHPDGDIHTPYGATEALPVASIAASEVLRETAAKTATGAGTCVGRRFPGIEWKVIAIDDGPLTNIEQTRELPRGEIGELLVRGPVVTSEYVTRTDCNPLHKVADGETFWHRMGDVGYLEQAPADNPRGERFWFCGRKAHRVTTARQTLFTEPCEAIFNQHPHVYRSALVGVGPRGKQRPVIIVEPWPEHLPKDRIAARKLIGELSELAAAYEHTREIETFFINPALPVDIRHNAKIFREQLAVWAAKRLPRE